MERSGYARNGHLISNGWDSRVFFCPGIEVKSFHMRLLLSFLIIVAPGISFSAPAIDTVSNSTVAHGGTYTITGSDFGSKSNAAPLKFEDFENGVNGAELDSTGYWSIDSNNASWGKPLPIFSNENNRQNSSLNARMYLTGLIDAAYRNDIPFGSHFYFSFWVNFSMGITCTGFTQRQLKLWTLTKNYPNPENQGGNCIITALLDANWVYEEETHRNHYIQPYCASHPSMYFEQYTDHTWTHVQVEVQQSDIGVDNGVLRVWMNGKLVEESTDVPFRDTADDSFSSFKFGWYQGNIEQSDDYPADTPSAVAIEYFDDIYFDDTISRILLCDNSSWSSIVSEGAHCENQIPTSWSDTSLGFRLNQGGLANNSNAYVFVVNASNEVNEAGRLVHIAADSAQHASTPDGASARTEIYNTFCPEGWSPSGQALDTEGNLVDESSSEEGGVESSPGAEGDLETESGEVSSSCQSSHVPYWLFFVLFWWIARIPQKHRSFG